MESIRRLTVRALAATALALAVAAAPAVAATLQPLKPCYVSAGKAEQRREGIAVRGTGFTPNSTIDISIDGIVQLSGTANVVGDVDANVAAPYQRFGERAFSLAVAERGHPTNVATAQSRVTTLQVRLRPREARTTQRVRFLGRGFTADAPVFAHYLFGGEVRKTVRLARRSTSPCGTFAVRRRQIPIRRPRTGRWTLQVDQRREYSPDHRPWVQVPIGVREDFRDV